MPFETEQQAYEAFGLTPPEPEHQEEPTQEPADGQQGGQAENTGAQDLTQEPGEEPEGGGESPSASDSGENPSVADSGEDKTPADGGQDPLRREHEQQMEQLRRTHEEQLDQMAASLGLRDPYNDNAPITTYAQLAAYQQRAQKARVDRLKQSAGLTDEQFDELVASLPEVQAAKQAREAAAQAEAAARQREARQRLDADIAAIGKLCPGIKDDSSLIAHESYPEIQRLLRENPGMGVLAAFKLANFDTLTSGSANAAAQRVRNNLSGKRHMNATQSRGEGGVHLTQEQEGWYRRLLPNATREEILRYHEKYSK